MSEVLKVYGRLYKYNTNCPMSKVSKEITICIIYHIEDIYFSCRRCQRYSVQNVLHLMVSMLEVSKVYLIYTVDSNTKFLNYIELQIKCLD